VLTLALGTTAAPAQDLPAPDAILATLRRVNDRFLAAYPDPGADLITDRARPSNIWTRATYFEGLMALHRVAPETRYVDYAVRWAASHQWDLAYGAADVRHADNQCCGQTYLDLYALDPQPERIAKIKAAIDSMVAGTKQDDWWWIDAIQMAMPVFARLGVLTGDARYFEKMHALFRHTMTVQGGRGLYNPAEKLWWRDADFDPPYQEPNGANCYWSRGNGWVFAGLARVLDVLPADATHRAEYVQIFQDMAAALVPLQRIDGYWNASLKDPDNYGGRELTGTAFFAYGMAWGIRQGFLPRAEYLPVVARAWRGLTGFAVRPDGSLGYVQGTGKQPSDGQPVTFDSVPNFDDFGTGAFLLAGTEVHRLSSVPAIDYIGIFK
jgi:unsaturated rhamnogalacturonyl hydrolase